MPLIERGYKSFVLFNSEPSAKTMPFTYSSIHLTGPVTILGPGEMAGEQDKQDSCSSSLVVKRQMQVLIQ